MSRGTTLEKPILNNQLSVHSAKNLFGEFSANKDMNAENVSWLEIEIGFKIFYLS